MAYGKVKTGEGANAHDAFSEVFVWVGLDVYGAPKAHDEVGPVTQDDRAVGTVGCRIGAQAVDLAFAWLIASGPDHDIGIIQRRGFQRAGDAGIHHIGRAACVRACRLQHLLHGHDFLESWLVGGRERAGIHVAGIDNARGLVAGAIALDRDPINFGGEHSRQVIADNLLGVGIAL